MVSDDSLRLLIVEDSDDDRDLLLRSLRISGLRFDWSAVATMDAFRDALLEECERDPLRLSPYRFRRAIGLEGHQKAGARRSIHHCVRRSRRGGGRRRDESRCPRLLRKGQDAAARGGDRARGRRSARAQRAAPRGSREDTIARRSATSLEREGRVPDPSHPTSCERL